MGVGGRGVVAVGAPPAGGASPAPVGRARIVAGIRGPVSRLSITLTNGSTLTHVLRRDRAEVIGRDPSCDIWVDDPSTSRRHAQFTCTPEGYVVEDLGSKNGTLVNDQPRDRHLLADNDVVLLGTVRVRFTREAEAAGAQSVLVTDRPPSQETARYSHPGAKVHLSKQRLQTLYDMSDRLTRVRDPQQLLSDAMDVCFEMLHCERGAIAVRRPGSRTVDWPVVRNLRGREGELTISRTTLSRALEHGERAIVTEDTLGQADPTVSMVQHGIRSAMCVPLKYEDEVLGVIYGDRVSTAATYTAEDVDFLAAIARQVSIGLKNARLLEEQRVKVQLERDIELARHIQTRLFPKDLPDRPDLKVAAINEPGNRVSGDYYDIMELPDGRVWMIIADVTGEGVAASLVMANLQAAVRATIDASADPAALMARWNRLIYENTDASRFITALLGLIDPASRTAQFTAAGHFPPIRLEASGPGAAPLEIKADFPLGIFETAAYTNTEVVLGARPCTLFCYTDGVIEAQNEAQSMFGHSTLVDLLAQHRDEPPARLLGNVRRAVGKFRGDAPQSDDLTMLAIAMGSREG
ncbi:MAG: FHA domain-containing protein [Phycisphaerales bacterium]|nr:MAG: FHA domain-containing protein [Phycisphaerales bacterium]